MKRALLIGVLLAGALVLAACGGNDESAETAPAATSGTGASTTASAQMETLKVALIPIIDYAPIYLGMEKGFFEEENLKLEPQIAQTGAAITASVVSGDAQIGAAAAVPEIAAAEKGLPITIVAPVNSAPEEGTTAVMVKEDSGINNAKDLNGKTIAVNALKAVSELITRAAVDKLGGDSSTLKFVTVPFPEMIPAMQADRAQGAQIAEPFLTFGKSQGFKVLFWPAWETEENMVISTLFSSKDYVNANPDVIERFRRAVVKSNEYAQANPDEVRRIITTYTQIKPDVAKQITLPNFDSEINIDSLKYQADLMVKYDFISKAPDINQLVYQPQS